MADQIYFERSQSAGSIYRGQNTEFRSQNKQGMVAVYKNDIFLIILNLGF